MEKMIQMELHSKKMLRTGQAFVRRNAQIESHPREIARVFGSKLLDAAARSATPRAFFQGAPMQRPRSRRGREGGFAGRYAINVL